MASKQAQSEGRDPVEDALDAAKLLACDAVGQMIQFWGFKAIMGRIWCLLFLEEDPLSAQKICERLTISTGAASMALNELHHWGWVRKETRPGERRTRYTAEIDLWKMIGRVLREREVNEVSRASDVFRQALEMLDQR